MYRVLLVDDEEFVRQGLKELIDWPACGFEVMDEAGNGEDALEIIRREKPELVITDIRMPVLDGLGLIRKVVQEERLSTCFIVVSGYNEFTYAQQAVKFGVCDFLLKPIDEAALQEALIALRDKLRREAVLHRQSDQLRKSEAVSLLIKGEYDERQVPEWGSWLGIPPGSPVYYVFVEVNDAHPWNDRARDVTNERMIEEVRHAVARLCPAVVGAHVHEHRDRLGLAIPAAHLPAGRDIGQFASALQKRLAGATGLPVFIYAGQAADGLARLRDAYESAKDALLYKFTDEEQTVFIYENVRRSSLNYVVLDGSFCQQLNEAMEEKDEAAMARAVDRIFGEFRNRLLAPEAVKASIHRCVSGILEMLARMEADKRSLRTLAPIIAWQDLNISMRELKRLFADFVTECSQWMAGRRKEALRGGIQKIKAYIDANYASNMSLKSIAGRFYMNPVYLGQLFKKAYGVYFNDYLLRLRIEEAKRLIRQTDLRIYEIAEKVGFNNAEYFVTQFEKIESTTPTEYRNKWR
ncbi:response regulator transcription factor [Paenibacillus arenilitoris]|uniref:Response regulator transcription factor n=1 Tax=Paenibacillus arenilitoris TaxID=2772299 RepID=A0A927H7N0_9BACL|nr:response regulator transcription factor [Paenibacillus arenilitoris]MBD2870828.1 response regulator transcription factor [Paenibacillus arenilitoris]